MQIRHGNKSSQVLSVYVFTSLVALYFKVIVLFFIIFFFDTSNSISWHRLLRRTIERLIKMQQLPLLYQAL